jgi:hypothetical protein
MEGLLNIIEVILNTFTTINDLSSYTKNITKEPKTSQSMFSSDVEQIKTLLGEDVFKKIQIASHRTTYNVFELAEAYISLYNICGAFTTSELIEYVDHSYKFNSGSMIVNYKTLFSYWSDINLRREKNYRNLSTYEKPKEDEVLVIVKSPYHSPYLGAYDRVIIFCVSKELTNTQIENIIFDKYPNWIFYDIYDLKYYENKNTIIKLMEKHPDLSNFL